MIYTDSVTVLPNNSKLNNSVCFSISCGFTGGRDPSTELSIAIISQTEILRTRPHFKLRLRKKGEKGPLNSYWSTVRVLLIHRALQSPRSQRASKSRTKISKERCLQSVFMGNLYYLYTILCS